MNKTKNTYEVLYIVASTLADEAIEEIISTFNKVITDNGGDVKAAGKWDKRRLAYEVKGHREGIYILTYFDAEPSLPKELDRVMRISDDVIRHLITRVEPQHVDSTRIIQPQAPPEPVAVEAVEEKVEEPAVAVEVEAPVAEVVESEPVAEPAQEEETTPEVE